MQVLFDINHPQIVSQSSLRNTALDIPDNWELKNSFILDLEAFGILYNLQVLNSKILLLCLLILYVLSQLWER